MNKPLKITEHHWPENTQPIITVFSWVYNQKDYIRQSIESILMQETNFPVEIIIHDDASNDGTAEIIKEYEAKYPRLFNNILQSENQWSQGKNVMVPLFEKPKGKHIALTHGDDYWTDPHKLQKQVDFLEANPEYSGVATGYKTVSKDDNLIGIHPTPPDKPNVITTLELIQKNGISTCTAMLKNNFITRQKDYDFIIGQTLGDLSLWLLSSLNGPIYLLPDITAAYRVNVGITSSFNEAKNAHISIKVREDFLAQYPVGFKVKLAYWANKFYYLNQAAIKYANSRYKAMACYYFLKSLAYYPLSFIIKQKLQPNNLTQYLKTIKAILRS